MAKNTRAGAFERVAVQCTVVWPGSASPAAQRVSRLASGLKHDLFTGAGSCRAAVVRMASLMSSPEMRDPMRHEYWYDRIVDAGTFLFKSDRDAIFLAAVRAIAACFTDFQENR